MTISATVIADSVSAYGKRITTLQLRYPRFIHAEFMTHRTFCIGGDARLDFELPAGVRKGSGRRVYSMSIREFVNKWHHGVAEHSASRFRDVPLNLDDDTVYTAIYVAASLGFRSATNLNSACRAGKVPLAWKGETGTWVATGAAWKLWRASMGTRSFSIRDRLSQMQIRQVDEQTGEVRLSTVADCTFSGSKPVVRVAAGDFTTVSSREHRFFTDQGWLTAGELIPGVSRICVYKFGTGAKTDPYKKINGRWVSRWTASVRDQVAERQHGVCALTGEALDPSFHIHHVEPKHLRPDLAFDIENVIAVNPDAHRDLHRVQGWQTGVPLRTQFVVVDSVEDEGEVDTYDLSISGPYPNFFADGIVVHNSRNASSSRAIPVKRLIEDVKNDPVAPSFWGANQKGMQAHAEMTQNDKAYAAQVWDYARSEAITAARCLADVGAHKQIVNRILEPFAHINVVVTATEWENFFNLRIHPDAQPEIQKLATEMRDAMAASKPQLLELGVWHLPYVLDEEHHNYDEDALIKASVARCARVSYKTHDGLPTTVEQDIDLYYKLVGSVPLHASPAEHQATPDVSLERADGSEYWLHRERHGNFVGWIQYRKLLEEEFEVAADLEKN